MAAGALGVSDPPCPALPDSRARLVTLVRLVRQSKLSMEGLTTGLPSDTETLSPLWFAGLYSQPEVGSGQQPTICGTFALHR